MSKDMVSVRVLVLILGLKRSWAQGDKEMLRPLGHCWQHNETGVI